MFALMRAKQSAKVRTTPLGVPVVPEVNNNSAGSSGLIAGVTGTALGRSCRVQRPVPKDIGRFTTIDKEHGGIREVDDILELV